MNSRRWMRVSLFAAPTLAAIALALLRGGPGPSRASAGPLASSATGMPELADVTLSMSQTQLAQFVETLAVPHDLPTPMLELEDIDTPDSAFQSGPNEQIAVKPNFGLRSILGGRHPIAVVDGTPRRMGDDLGSGWTLTDIDIEQLAIEVAHVSGVRARIEQGDR